MPRRYNLDWAQSENSGFDPELLSPSDLEDPEDEESERRSPNASNTPENSDPENSENSEEDEKPKPRSHSKTHPLPIPESYFYLSKNKSTKWEASPVQKKPKRPCTITRIPGVKPFAKKAESLLECWELFFDDDVINKIVDYTNVYLTSMRMTFDRERDARPTDDVEIKALLGVLYMLGVKRSSHFRYEPVSLLSI